MTTTELDGRIKTDLGTLSRSRRRLGAAFEGPEGGDCYALQSGAGTAKTKQALMIGFCRPYRINLLSPRQNLKRSVNVIFSTSDLSRSKTLSRQYSLIGNAHIIHPIAAQGLMALYEIASFPAILEHLRKTVNLM